MEKLLQRGLIVCLALLPVACWQRDAFDPDLTLTTRLMTPPLQAETSAAPFDVALNGISYTIEPQYEYDMHGLVVSSRFHDGDRMIHRLWNDHLNVADVCVVWGRNAAELDLNAYSFRSGEFTCFVETRDSDAWARFDMAGLANNHLITEDGYLRDRLEELRVGDQIRVQGWLASYSHDHGQFRRGTSVTRTDTGNGACETIYVRSFSILSSMTNNWRWIFDLSLFGAFALALWWMAGVMTGRFSHRTET